MTLCFRQAYLKNREITEKEYIGHLLAHFRGLLHPQDSDNDEGAIVAKLDPFGASVREVALMPGYEPLQGKSGLFGAHRKIANTFMQIRGRMRSVSRIALQTRLTESKLTLQNEWSNFLSRHLSSHSRSLRRAKGMLKFYNFALTRVLSSIGILNGPYTLVPIVRL